MVLLGFLGEVIFVEAHARRVRSEGSRCVDIAQKLIPYGIEYTESIDVFRFADFDVVWKFCLKNWI